MTVQDLEGRIINADCMDILKQLPDKCIDLVLTDCPYRIVGGGCTITPGRNEVGGIFSRRNSNTSDNAKSGKLFNENDIKFEVWLPEVYRVLKDGTHCYIMINGRNIAELQTKAEKVGFEYQQLLVWDKGNANPNRYYMSSCEYILMLRKGYAKNINDEGTKNILRVSNIIGNKLHPTEKPVPLMEIMIENSSNEHDIVLDPFGGSGTTAIACHRLKRRFICIEKDTDYWKASLTRLEWEKAQPQLF